MFRRSYCKIIHSQFAEKMIGKVKLNEFLTLCRPGGEGRGGEILPPVILNLDNVFDI